MIKIRERLNRARREEGLTIIEISVAIGIFAVVMILLTTMLGASLRNILQGKQRSVAVTDAEQLLETARNVAFEDIGHDSSDDFDASTEAGLIDNGGVFEYTTDPPCSSTGTSEPLAFVANPDPVFDPHIRSRQTGSTNMTRSVYVTEVDENCDGTFDAKRVIVRSVFANPGNPGASDEVRLQTIISSTGSLPTAIPPLSGLAEAIGASATVRLADGDGADIENPEDLLSLEMNRSVGDTRVVSVSRVRCTSTLPRLSGSTSAGGNSASTTVDNDPDDTTYGTSDFDTTTGSISFGDPYSNTTTSSSASCSAEAPSRASPNLPEGHGSSSTDQATSLTYDPSGLGLDSLLGLSDLISVLETSNADASTDLTHTELTAGQRTARQVNFEATSSLSDVTVLGGTASTLGLDFSQGLIHVTPHEITARAFANGGFQCTGALPDVPCSGDAEIDMGTGFDVWVFDPDGDATGCDQHTGSYCVIQVDDLDSLPGSVSATGGASTTLLDITTNVDITFDGPSSSVATKTPGGEKYEQVFEPMSATARLSIMSAGLRVLDVEVELDIGRVLARACQGLASGAQGCL